MDLPGKVALVTGAGSGIGRATALAMAQAGATVVVTDRDEDGGPETLEMLQAAGGTGSFVLLDVRRADQVKAAVAHAVQAHGGLHAAFNNAGWEGTTHFLPDLPEGDWDGLMDINLKGVYRCLQEEMRVMQTGSIVNCGSVAGLIGFAGSAAYVASKHGINGLTRSAALEGAPRGLRVNAVCPGGIRTPMLDRAFQNNPELERGLTGLHPLGRLGEPQEIADAVVWLCSDRASFVTGAVIAVDGGWTAA